MKKITYKGFDRNLKCRDMQYEIGESYDKKNTYVKCCSDTGFHSCENPLDVFKFYAPANSRFAECEVSGNIDKKTDKICSSKITINTEISIFKIVKIGVEYILSKIDFNNNKESNTGYRSAATNTGYRSAATNTGYQSAATNTGDQSAATNTGYQSAAINTGDRSAAIAEGDNSIAIATGYESKAKGKIGCWLLLAEQDENYKIINVKCRKVDGKNIKADTFYSLKNNKFVIS